MTTVACSLHVELCAPDISQTVQFSSVQLQYLCFTQSSYNKNYDGCADE